SLRTVRRMVDEIAKRSAERPEFAPVKPFGLLTARDRAALPGDVIDAFPASRLQLGMLFENELGGKNGVYLDVFGYRLKVLVDESLFRQSVGRVVARHPLFRAAFELTGYSTPLMLFYDREVQPLQWHDIRQLSDDQKAKLI